MSAIVVAKPDAFWPTSKLHQDLASALPRRTKLVVLENKDLGVWGGPPPRGSVRVMTETDSQWARDFSPTFVRTPEGKLEAVEFKYHYPGADGVATQVAQRLGVPVKSSSLVVEVGNLLADKGRLFATTRLLEANPGRTRAQIEKELKEKLYVEHLEWMTPLPGEPTGHLDMYAKLLTPELMLVSDTPHPGQKKVMDQAARRFADLGYQVVRVMNAVTPPKRADGEWGPTRSYANALVVNGTAFVPQYFSKLDVENGHGKLIAGRDRKAMEAYAKADLKVVGVPAFELIDWQGSVHCMTNVLPAEVKLSRLK